VARVQTLPNIDNPASSRALHVFKHDHVLNERSPDDPGTVKFYNARRGFGFIAPADGGNDVFVHETALERAGIANLVEGQKVSFDTELDRRSGKTAVGDIQAA